jgi:hypothetical protein
MPDSPFIAGKLSSSSREIADFLLGATSRWQMTAQRSASSVTKLVVAVHGIGDQVRNETILSTAVRFCDHYDYEGMIALGAFYRKRLAGGPSLVIDSPPCAGLTGNISFAEAHWADIARAISDEEHTLQETKAWARSIVQRIRVLAARGGPATPDIDYRRIHLVLEEMIDTIGVLETLFFLASKAGLFDFELRKILDAFLGDVQLVAEFQPVRDAIVGRFHHTMAAAAREHDKADIFVVAHSEGTVVSLLGLLEACDDPDRHPWIQRVRGYMTLGSPIDKHLILWPALFAKFTQPSLKTKAEIRWFNYVDYGDPVGFNLNTAREWLDRTGYKRVFKFDQADDFSFRRYPVPGAAHVGYWNDPEVFDHFIRRVVDPPAAPTPAEIKWLAKGPRNVWWVPLVSYGVAYLLPLAAIHGGVFVLCKAVSAYLSPDSTTAHPNFVATFLGLSWLLAGTTVWLRLVWLARAWHWFLIGAAIYGASAWGFFALMAQPHAGINELTWFEPFSEKLGWSSGTGTLVLSAVLVVLILAVDLSRRLFRGAR